MSIKSMTYYTAICDGCGASHGETSDYSAWSDIGTAVEMSEYDFWLTVNTEDGQFNYCEECADPRLHAQCGTNPGECEHCGEPWPCPDAVQPEQDILTAALPIATAAAIHEHHYRKDR